MNLRTLLLMRHAKSDWDAGFSRDHDRPLNDRGRRAAKRMGIWLRETDEAPERIVSSSATRARQTAERAAEYGGLPDPEFQPVLYGASAAGLVAVAARLPDDVERAMLVGHEPTLSSAIALLAGATVRFPTAAVARIDLDIDRWDRIEPLTGTLIWMLPPRLLDREAAQD